MYPQNVCAQRHLKLKQADTHNHNHTFRFQIKDTTQLFTLFSHHYRPTLQFPSTLLSVLQMSANLCSDYRATQKTQVLRCTQDVRSLLKTQAVKHRRSVWTRQTYPGRELEIIQKQINKAMYKTIGTNNRGKSHILVSTWREARKQGKRRPFLWGIM